MRVTAPLVLTMMLLTACATSQAPPATVGAGAPRATSSAPAPVPAAAASPAGQSSEGVDQELIKEGYKPARHDGTIYYCKVVKLSGGRYPVNRCYTAAQIRQSEQETKAELNHLHMPGACHGMGCS